MSKNGRELDIIMLGNGRIVSYDSEFIFEHSNYANTVRLISPDIGLGYTVELNMVRADGIEGVPLGMRYIGAADCDVEGIARKCYIWSAELSEWHLYKSGKMLISISAINGHGVRIQSGIVQVYVNMSVRGAYTPLDTSTAEVLAAQIAALSDLVSDAIDSVEFISDKSSGEYLKLKVTTVSGDESYINIGADKSIVNIISLVDVDGRNILRITKASGEVIDIHLSALDKAVIDAENAFNNSSIALTVADDANRTAKEALEQAKVTGTQVEVNGKFQQKIAFIDDPQAQIDAKTQVNVGGVPQGIVDFTSDPQAQIDAKTAVNIGGVRQSVVEFVSDPQEQINSRTQVIIDGNVEPEVRFISDPQRQINSKTQVNVDGVGQGLISFVSDPQAQINNLNIEINRVDNSAQQGIAQVDVKAEQGITTANEAREIAQEALEQSKVTGTQVQVGGVFQPTLDFTSDPQEQLDGKVNKSGDTVTGRLTLAGGASIYSGKENTYIELGNVGRTCLEFHAQSDPNVLLDYDAMILARDATSQTDYGSAILEYIAREHRFTKGDIYNAYGQAMRGFKTVTQGAILNDVRSGFYADGYDLYSKSVVVGEGNDKFVLTWDFGGTYSRGLWVRAYSDKNLAVEQKALLIDPTQLEISTANGWTIGGTGLESPTVNGIYLFACLLNLLGTRYWVVSNGFNVKAADSFAVPILFLTRAGVLAVSDTTWKIHNLHQNVTLEQVAYKKII